MCILRLCRRYRWKISAVGEDSIYRGKGSLKVAHFQLLASLADNSPALTRRCSRVYNPRPPTKYFLFSSALL